MKKFWPTVLVSLLIISSVPVNAMADTSTVNLNRLSYNKIEENILAFNPTVRANNEFLADAWNPINDGLKLIELTETNLKATIGLLSEKLPKDTNGVPIPVTPVRSVTLGPKDTIDLSNTINYVNYNLLMLYQSQLGNLLAQKASLTAQKDNRWKSYLQTNMGNDQIVWGTQQMFLSYQGLKLQTEALKDNRASVESQVRIMKLQEELGMVTSTDRSAAELQLSDLDVTIKSLNDAQNTLKGSLNLFLGQDHDTDLMIEDAPLPDYQLIKAMDYEDDLKTAIDNSYMVRLQDETENRDTQTRQVKMDFDEAFKDVQTKQESLVREKAKLATERVKWDLQELRYNLGMISLLARNASKTTFDAQARKVTTSEMDLVKSSTAYDWLLEGVSVLTSTGKR